METATKAYAKPIHSSMATMIRIVLVDDHALFRSGLSALFGTTRDMKVVGEAGDARQARQVIEAEKPAVVILDVSLPGTSGIAAMSELRRYAPDARFLVVSMHGGHDVVAEALGAGASGYALKHQPGDEIMDAVRRVAAGQPYLAPSLPEALLDPVKRAERAHPLASLSAREREIFDLVVRGFSTEAIAKQLFISAKTVETHRAHINKKLGLHSAAELVRFAARCGLIRE